MTKVLDTDMLNGIYLLEFNEEVVIQVMYLI